MMMVRIFVCQKVCSKIGKGLQVTPLIERKPAKSGNYRECLSIAFTTCESPQLHK